MDLEGRSEVGRGPDAYEAGRSEEGRRVHSRDVRRDGPERPETGRCIPYRNRRGGCSNVSTERGIGPLDGQVLLKGRVACRRRVTEIGDDRHLWYLLRSYLQESPPGFPLELVEIGR